MPWSARDADRFKRGLGPKQKREWAHIANSALAKCEEEGGKDCEKRAIMQANGAVKTISPDPRLVSDVVEKQEDDAEVVDKGYSGYVPFGITSFADLDTYRNTQEQAREIWELTDELHMLMQNVINNPDAGPDALDKLFKEFQARIGQASSMEKSAAVDEKSAIKRENGIDFPPGDYAYVPDPASPSTWKLRLTESPGKVTVAQLGRAAAALSSGGFRGNKAEIPSAALAAVKRRIRQEYRTLKVPENNIPASVKENFSIFKNAEGQYRFLAVYSNCFRDDDGIPEIISSKSHTNFVEMVDEGIVPYPSLMHYHIPGTEWGQCDMVDFVDGFAIAGGYILEGKEAEAELMLECIEAGDDIRMSHGMPEPFIARDKDDPTIIEFHITTEISDLPFEKAANKLTDFIVLSKETHMPLSNDKRQYLRDKAGYSDEQIASVEAALAGMSKAAVAAGIESKEAATPPAAPVEPVAEQQPADEEAKPVAEEAAKSATPATEDPITREEIANAFGAMIQPLIADNEDKAARIATLEAEVKELRVANKQYEQAVEDTTPVLSLAELMAMQVVGQKAARVDGRTTLAKNGPVEAPPDETPISGVPRVDQLIRNAQSQR